MSHESMEVMIYILNKVAAWRQLIIMGGSIIIVMLMIFFFQAKTLQEDPNMFRPELLALAASLEREAVLFFSRRPEIDAARP